MSTGFSETLPRVSVALEANAVEVRKGSQLVLADADFTIYEGSFAALIGPSGSGKTTLLRILAFLEIPATGMIRICGRELNDQWRPHSCLPKLYPFLTYVPQTTALWPHMTLRENICFAIDRDQLRGAVDETCSILEIIEILDRKPAFVSHGQRQRAALARALVLQPAILLLDEITAALDDRLAKKVWQLLVDKTRAGITVFASTHDASLLAACDQIYRINNSTTILVK
jgi:ABC-type multidrug transport system ATPase subunit